MPALCVSQNSHPMEMIKMYLIAINYCMLYAKHYIYLEKLKEENKKIEFNIDLLGYLCYLKYILKIEKSICNRKNQIAKVDKFNTIFENL